MFGKRKIEKKTYDKETQKPVIKSSICTGEQVVGFKDIHTGKFEEVMLIRDEKEMEKFREMYGVEMDQIHKEY